ncbi:hypothetical protein JOF56_001527 [Kibdelosporangium banguiense]|uniref:DUF7711 domain-containing protein n=1 Tax=Kibdelosporangium banguiense TaxID=1365924 RepID=A0ABS4T9Q3_9PSEU|nr:hypothetical protein [Kibdelosporangium banguiense]MBP2321142.1 hypothetical protein [Kibdelosporangium banguiense]
MKWTRALHHLEALAGECTRMHELPGNISPLRVTQLWAFGKVVEERADLDWVRVALSVDLPAGDVPWLSMPRAATHWSRAARLKEPLHALWRSDRAPVWNHFIVRPVLLWSAADGIAEEAFTALREDKVDSVRIPAPTTEELGERIGDELAISLRAVRGRVQNYEKKRWSPGKLEPVADDLWSVTHGYLDLLDADPRR